MITDRPGFMIMSRVDEASRSARGPAEDNATKTALNGAEAKQRSARCLIGMKANDATGAKSCVCYAAACISCASPVLSRTVFRDCEFLSQRPEVCFTRPLPYSRTPRVIKR